MPIDLSLCNIDYVIENDEPVVYLFTRDPNGKQVIIADRTFEPYFYVESRALFDPRIKRIIGVVGKELSPRVRRIEFGFRGLTRLGVSELARVVCKTPSDVGEIRRKLHNLKPPIETFEADILFVLRYLIDRGIKCGVRYDPERKEILGPAEPNSNFRVLFIDIEVLAKSQYDLHKFRAPVMVIGLYDSYSKEYYIHYTSRYPIRGLSSHFKYYPNETALLQSMIDYLSNEHTRPDLILSFTTFDMMYLLRRMMLRGMDYKAISPIRKVKIDAKRHQILIGGMEYLDIGEVYRTLYRRHAKYYSLEEICRVALGSRFRKLPLKYGDVYTTWLYDKKNVLLYNLRDVYLIKKLTYTTGLLESLDVIRRKIGVRMSDALIPSRIADIAHLRLLHGKVVLPTRPIEKVEHLDQLKYKGAEVFECKAGIYENVLGIDWEAIYTNVIKSFNIGYNTLDPFGKLRIDDNHRFKSPEEEESWTVQIIREIEPLLVENKRLIKEAQKAGDERLVNLLKAKRLGLKAILHGQYGYFGFKGNPVKGYPASRLLCITIAEAIAMVPRIIQEEGVKKVAKELGYDLIYGDSVTGDTPVMIRRHGLVDILPIEDLVSAPNSTTRVRFPIRGIEVLTSKGWAPIKYVYRHKCSKPVKSLFAYGARVDVSVDHSLIVKDKIVTPLDLNIGDMIERVEASLPCEVQVDPEVAWLLGFFLARGTAGYYSTCRKYSFHIDSKDRSLLERARSILQSHFCCMSSIIYVPSDGLFRLIPRSPKGLICLFRSMFYSKRGLKKVPAIILNSTIEAKRVFLEGFLSPIRNRDDIRIASDNKVMLSGLHEILHSLGYKVTVKAYKSRPWITELVILKGTGRHRDRSEIYCILDYNSRHSQYLYDLETENHEFTAGIGNVRLHNTDSLYVKLPPNVDPETVRDQFQERLSKFIRERWNIDPRHFKLDIDVLFRRVVFLAKKRYAGIDSNGMIINKGLELVRRDQSILTSSTQEGLIKHIFSGSSREEIKRFVAEQVNRIYSAPLLEIAVPANLRHRYDEYKTSSQHLKAFVFSRDYLNIPLMEGERFYYVLIKPINMKCKIKIGDKVRTFIPDAVAFTHPDQIMGDLEVKVESTLLNFFNSNVKTKIKIEIDYDRMIEKTIKGKVMPFLELLHISWDEILAEAKRLRSNK